MIRFTLLLLSIFAASPALSLSCLRPSIESAFMTAHKSDDAYIPVVGHFTGFLPRKESKSSIQPDRHFTARFIGKSVTANGDGRPLDIQVNISELCLASWCPYLKPNTDMITFLRRDDNAYAFEIDACGGNAFSGNSAAHLETLRTCLRNMHCTPTSP